MYIDDVLKRHSFFIDPVNLEQLNIRSHSIRAEVAANQEAGALWPPSDIRPHFPFYDRVREVLPELNLSQHRRIALVGRAGSGKSSDDNSDNDKNTIMTAMKCAAEKKRNEQCESSSN